MSPSCTVHGGQHDAKYVTFEWLLHGAFVADEIWGDMLEPARALESKPAVHYYMPAGFLRFYPSTPLELHPCLFFGDELLGNSKQY